MIDGLEHLRQVADWLRESFLPGLPDSAFVVMMGRNRLGSAWTQDPSWRALLHVHPLRNLSAPDAKAYLDQRGVARHHHDAVLDFTYGHPMALSLVADIHAQQGYLEASFSDSPDLIQALVDQFVQQVPDEEHLIALEAGAVVRFVTEPLLAHLTQTTRPHALFRWLRQLSFVEVRRSGLYVHDLARGVLLADLRWRNRDRYQQLRDRARSYYAARLQAASAAGEQRQLLSDYTFLHHESPFLRPLFAHLSVTELEAVYTTPVQLDEHDAMLALVETSEGHTARAVAASWLAQAPDSALLFRDGAGRLLGCTIHLTFESGKPSPASDDPVTAAAADYSRTRAPLRRGERLTVLRFWSVASGQPTLGYVAALMFVDAIRKYTQTRRLGYSAIATPDPTAWASVFEHLGFQRISAQPIVVGDASYELYGHDWRGEPPSAWLAQLAERDLSAPKVPVPAQPIAVLDEAAFTEAVRRALKHFATPERLAENPLCNARCVLDRASVPAPDDAERVEALRALLRKALADMDTEHGRLHKLHRVLQHTYFTPAPTQELAAERLGLPFSTYRRHLQRGLEHIVDVLWRIELGG
ncbi:MAG: ATP-binding protein [Bacteroidota bacterium]